MGSYKSIWQIRRSGNLHGIETIVTVEIRVLLGITIGFKYTLTVKCCKKIFRRQHELYL